MTTPRTVYRAIVALGLASAVMAVPAVACESSQKAAQAAEAGVVPAATLATLPTGQQIAMQGNAALVRIRAQISMVPIDLPNTTYAAMTGGGADATAVMDF